MNHVMSTCAECGDAFPRHVMHDVDGAVRCGPCYGAAGAVTRDEPPDASPGGEAWREPFCALVGVLCLGAGFFILVFAPGANVPGLASLGIEPGEVVNLQKLYLGQTLAIVGAIFLAVGVRPR